MSESARPGVGSTEPAGRPTQSWLRDFGQRVDLKTRLSLLIGLLLGVVLVLAMLAVLGNSRRAVRGEIDAVMRLASALLDAPAQADGSLAPVLPGLLTVLEHTRHLCVDGSRVANGAAARSCPGVVDDEVPDWFASHVTVAPRELRRTMVGADGARVALIIRADPADEILEAWNEARPLLLLIVAIGFLTNAIVVFTVWRAFRPIDLIRDALTRIGRGEWHPGLPQGATPELRGIIDGMVELGANLERARSDNRRLLRHSLDVQEQERRAIARELHDEIGQSLAAMDADAALLMKRGLAAGESDLQRRVQGIRNGIATLYDGLHTLLARLRPAGLDEFGLGSALQNLAADWSGRCPWIRFEVQIDLAEVAGEPLVQVYLYRIAQEALTNAARHSGARRISLILCADAQGATHLRIADDGRGLRAAKDSAEASGRAGLGLLGIEERAEILGAALTIGPDGDSGTCVAVCLPPVSQRSTSARVSHSAVT